MTNAWIITTDSRIDGILTLMADQFDDVTAIVLGSADISGVHSAMRIEHDANIPAETYAGAVADIIANNPGVLIARQGAAERVIATAVAARLQAPILTDVRELGANHAVVSRFGGISMENLEFTGPIVAMVDGGGTPEGAAVDASKVEAHGYSATVTAKDTNDGEQTDISSAKKLVAVGRGFAEEKDVDLARSFAAAMGAEIACSRPLAEGNGWLSRETYVGISGQRVAPDVYVAVGISGQIQHTAGMDESKIVVAINKDDKAAIFDIADYGIVGDLYDVLPALTKALES